MSLSVKREPGNGELIRMNSASSRYLDLFSVAESRTGSRFDTVEVWGSSPHGPTIFSPVLTRFFFILRAPVRKLLEPLTPYLLPARSETLDLCACVGPCTTRNNPESTVRFCAPPNTNSDSAPCHISDGPKTQTKRQFCRQRKRTRSLWLKAATYAVADTSIQLY